MDRKEFFLSRGMRVAEEVSMLLSLILLLFELFNLLKLFPVHEIKFDLQLSDLLLKFLSILVSRFEHAGHTLSLLPLSSRCPSRQFHFPF